MSATHQPRHEISSQFLRGVCLLLLLGASSILNAQCPVGDGNAWRQGREVTFYIDPNMSPAEQDGIRSAIAKWNAANQTNGSGVRFSEVLNIKMLSVMNRVTRLRL